ncbi:FimV/HubP family polar landmark protein [Aliidiomarina sp.]|uniref:FimV/HubP family polar landmark protein n=1 Tax=Aliidiomarina sp. TaxID=1872439 RepID=UPI003A4DED4E
MNNKQPLGKNNTTARFVKHKFASFGCVVLLASMIAASAFNSQALALSDTEETAQPASSAEVRANQYGPTTRADTIWVIANRIHPDRSVSIYQTMAAIVDLNLDVVVDDEINVLPVGVMLTLPTANQIRATHAENARKRMIPKLGGSLTEIAFDFTDEEFTRKSEELALAESELAEERTRVGRLQDELADWQSRYDEVQQQLERAEVELTSAQESRDSAVAALQELREIEQNRTASVTSKVSQYWQQQGQTGWLLAILALVILILLTAVLFGKRRKQDSVDDAPYPKAAARYLADSKTSAAKAEKQEEASADQNDAGDSANTTAVNKTDFRDIDEIIDEAEADADADSDIDPGQTPEEAEQAAREELAAQIDLARAYLEMGEFDEATAALEEVMPMADAELQQEAEQLLAKVNQQKSKE